MPCVACMMRVLAQARKARSSGVTSGRNCPLAWARWKIASVSSNSRFFAASALVAQHGKLIGVIELLGGLGMILPARTGIAPILTPLAATGLAITMVLAGLVHLRRKEANRRPVNIVLFALAAFVAITRFDPYSY